MPETLDFNKCDLYGGFTGLKPPQESIDFGEGLVLSRTFAHLIQAKVMAFAAARPGTAHPAPWAAVRGGRGLDIHCQLLVPKDFYPGPFFDHLNTIWWISALIRLRGVPNAFVSAVSTGPFTKDLASSKDHQIFALEGDPQRRWPISLPDKEDNAATFEWVCTHWKPGGALMGESERFNTFVQAVDSSLGRPTAQLALIEIWGGLDQLFAESPGEVRFKNSLRISSYLEPFGASRRELFGSIMQLYEKRSQAAHGGKTELSDALTGSYLLARRVIMAIIERGKTPTRGDLDELALGGSHAEAKPTPGRSR